MTVSRRVVSEQRATAYCEKVVRVAVLVHKYAIISARKVKPDRDIEN
jgi:hypothetical protein